ncbi:unnamed protein product [Cyprideis torosa]|uniref:Uncharacterized protein n=1 Tax=Cyprideis torosa TaxID=163714 RepID=A0A7R8WB32_9CRUS|nr:unnamed protein product [Cyprideis torosa]CAG0890366.1 unnamed protein product [Cyprideis torosa]
MQDSSPEQIRRWWTIALSFLRSHVESSSESATLLRHRLAQIMTQIPSLSDFPPSLWKDPSSRDFFHLLLELRMTLTILLLRSLPSSVPPESLFFPPDESSYSSSSLVSDDPAKPLPSRLIRLILSELLKATSLPTEPCACLLEAWSILHLMSEGVPSLAEESVWSLISDVLKEARSFEDPWAWRLLGTIAQAERIDRDGKPRTCELPENPYLTSVLMLAVRSLSTHWKSLQDPVEALKDLLKATSTRELNPKTFLLFWDWLVKGVTCEDKRKVVFQIPTEAVRFQYPLRSEISALRMRYGSSREQEPSRNDFSSEDPLERHGEAFPLSLCFLGVHLKWKLLGPRLCSDLSPQTVGTLEGRALQKALDVYLTCAETSDELDEVTLKMLDVLGHLSQQLKAQQAKTVFQAYQELAAIHTRRSVSYSSVAKAYAETGKCLSKRLVSGSAQRLPLLSLVEGYVEGMGRLWAERRMSRVFPEVFDCNFSALLSPCNVRQLRTILQRILSGILRPLVQMVPQQESPFPSDSLGLQLLDAGSSVLTRDLEALVDAILVKVLPALERLVSREKEMLVSCEKEILVSREKEMLVSCEKEILLIRSDLVGELAAVVLCVLQLLESPCIPEQHMPKARRLLSLSLGLETILFIPPSYVILAPSFPSSLSLRVLDGLETTPRAYPTQLILQAWARVAFLADRRARFPQTLVSSGQADLTAADAEFREVVDSLRDATDWTNFLQRLNDAYKVGWD